MQTTKPNIPVPEQGESFERYSIRALSELRDSGLDPDERNQLVRYTWHQHRGLTEEEQVAQKTFDKNKYVYVPDVCVFAEHETVDKQGKPRKYGLKELAQIVRDCNSRAADRGVFAAISDGHTSNPGDANKRDPQILGWTGPCRLGVAGRKNPVWCILTDEYHIKEAAPILAGKPRRSVELWTFRNGAQMHFDPVAAIGAEAPRLPLPMRYSMANVGCGVEPELSKYSVESHDGCEVEKYTYSASVEKYDGACGAPAAAPSSGASFATPGAASTHVMQHDGGKPKKRPVKYAETPNKPVVKPTGDKPMGDATELAREVVQFLSQTPEFQWLREKMQEESNEAAPGNKSLDELAAAPPGTPEPDGLPPTGQEPGPAPQDDDLSDIIDKVGGDKGVPTPPESSEPDGDEEAEDEPEKKPFPPQKQPEEKNAMAYSNENDGNAIVEKYTQLQASHDTLMSEHARTCARLEVLEKSRTDAHRKMRINELAQKYQINADEEATKWCYSMGSAEADESFDKWVGFVEKYAAQKVQNYDLPSGDVPATEDPNGEQSEKYQAALRTELLKVHNQFVASGKPSNYAEEMKIAKERLGK